MNQNSMKQNKMNHTTIIQGKNILPELLAPAGSFEHLKAAVKAGADAVYMGGQQFGARAYADNFTKETVIEALHYAHFYEKKIYLTVNTLMKEEEIAERLYDFLLPFYEEGLDGVIVQDLGAASFIRKHFPEMQIHGSTQMTITDVYGAKAAARLGMNRIVPARELSMEELKHIKEETGLELEVFIHGALCYCYSGQCLLSSMYGGRSGNRGRCAQPCRLPYQVLGQNGTALHPETGKKQNRQRAGAKGNYVLSPKDLCAITMLPALIEAGMDSFKIEGRMKNVDYVAGVTAIYRKYLDAYQKLIKENRKETWHVSQKDYAALEELYSRSGFTDGYWKRHNGQEMMSTVHPRNLGRKIGRVRQVRRGQIAMELERDSTLHPKDILIIPVQKQEEVVCTVPAKLCREGKYIILHVPEAKKIREGMEIYRRKNEALSDWIQTDILKAEKKYPVNGQITIKKGEPIALTLYCREKQIAVFGKTAESSEKRPITKEDVYRQLNKTGQVPFYLDTLQIEIEDNVFVPMSAVKEIRQQGFAVLQKNLENSSYQKRAAIPFDILGKTGKATQREKKISLQSEEKSDTVISLNNKKKPADTDKRQSKIAVAYDERILQYCLGQPFFDGICLPLDFWSPEQILAMAQKINQQGKHVFLSMPQIVRKKDIGLCKKIIGQAKDWAGVYVHTIGQAQLLYEMEGNVPIYASASFYQWNHWALSASAALFQMAGAQLPVELSAKECKDLLTGWKTLKQEKMTMGCCVYGRIPVMRSAQCIKKTRGICNHQQEILFLENQNKKRLPVVSHCEFCYNTIWTDRPRNLIGQENGTWIGNMDTVSFHFFMDEEKTVEKIIKDYMQWERNGFGTVGNQIPDGYWKYGIE